MAENTTGQEPPPLPRTLRQSAQQAGLFVLFGTILMIPRIRRLRRRVWAWTCVRLGAAACGGWLLWRYTHAGASKATLAFGVLCLAFSLLVRARPALRSVDDLAKQLSALIVLHGGAFRLSQNAPFVEHTQIFVCPEHLIVMGPAERRLAEIPLAGVRDLARNPVASSSAKGGAAWEVAVDWDNGKPCTTVFRYEGVFAEHLARVTESTVRSQWKKELPIIQP